MAADTQTDLFTFGLTSKKPLKEQVTPHKLSLLVLIHEYSIIKKDENLAPNMFALDEREPNIKFTEAEKRNFMITILQLLQSPDLKLKELSARIQDNLNIQLYETFCDRLHDFCEEGIRLIQDFFQALSCLLIQEGPLEPCISKFSVLGVFIRRMILAFEKLTFSQVIKLHAKFVDYYNEGRNEQVPEESNIFGGSLTDTALSLSEVRFNKSGLTHSMDALRLTDWKSSQDPSGFFSQKQAEYFIAQQGAPYGNQLSHKKHSNELLLTQIQGMLLQHNENEALSPQVLQERIMDMLKARPDIAEAHFLSYLNSLRVKEYCTAVHNLYHYFDRNMSLMETNNTNKGREEDVCRRYAALNLALLHYKFGHKKESKAALHEAIRLAQGTNDHVCLQHALSWLYRLEEQGSSKTANLMERAVAKSSELSLPNLTSLGVQSLAKHNAFAGAKPSSVFEYIMKSDILNCQHSQSGFMCMSYTQKSALWKMYGKRECHAMTSQLVLNLDTSESCVYHNGEPVCIALCNMAKLHADNGQYTLAFDMINNAKLRFPPHTQHAYLWMSCEQEILFDRTLLNRKWSITEQAIVNLKALNELEAELRNAILCKEKGDVTSALSQLNKLLEKLSKADTEVSPDFKCRVLLTLAELYSQSGNPTVAINYILECITRSRQHHLQQMEAIASAHLAYAQLQMQLPEQSLKLLDQQMLTIFSHGSVYDKARVLYCCARCQVASGAKSTKADKKTALLAAVNILDRVVDMFRTVEAFIRVKDALYYQARLYNELNYTAERNRCAYQFKQLDQQYPTLNKACVNVL